jgi:hypothetical protein
MLGPTGCMNERFIWPICFVGINSSSFPCISFYQHSTSKLTPSGLFLEDIMPSGLVYSKPCRAMQRKPQAVVQRSCHQWVHLDPISTAPPAFFFLSTGLIFQNAHFLLPNTLCDSPTYPVSPSECASPTREALFSQDFSSSKEFLTPARVQEWMKSKWEWVSAPTSLIT